MSKVDRLRNRVEPFAALFWALGINLANTWPCPPARQNSTAVHKACPYMVIVGSILSEDALPPPLFLSRYIIYLWSTCFLVQISACGLQAVLADCEDAVELLGKNSDKPLDRYQCTGAGPFSVGSRFGYWCTSGYENYFQNYVLLKTSTGYLFILDL